MTTNENSRPYGSPQWSNRQWLLIVALASLAAGCLVFWISDRRQAGMVDEATRRQVEEFIVFADRIGVLDRARVEEALIIAKESEWEDIDQSTNPPTTEVAIP